MDKIHVASDNKVFADVIYLMLIGCTVKYCKEILDQACALQLFGMFLKNIIRIFFYADLAKDPYQLLLAYGFKNLVLCDRCGIMSSAYEGLNWAQQEMLAVTNLKDEKGTLADALKGADVFLGFSRPNMVTIEMVKTMNRDAIVFACANPTPEIFPEDAIAGGAKIISTGRSDYPNQINNVLVFPGVFRGVFDVRAKDINEEMKMAAAMALASVIPESELNENNIIPKAFDPIVKDTVAKAVAEAARRSGVARI